MVFFALSKAVCIKKMSSFLNGADQAVSISENSVTFFPVWVFPAGNSGPTEWPVRYQKTGKTVTFTIPSDMIGSANTTSDVTLSFDTPERFLPQNSYLLPAIVSSKGQPAETGAVKISDKTSFFHTPFETSLSGVWTVKAAVFTYDIF